MPPAGIRLVGGFYFMEGAMTIYSRQVQIEEKEDINIICEQFTPLVKKYARKYMYVLQDGEAEAWLALVRAVRTYDPETGVPLAGYLESQTTFGEGDGSTTFNLPDLRGEFIRGYDDGRGVDGGRVLGSKQKGTLAVYDAIFDDKTAKHLKTIDVFGPDPFDFSVGKQEVGFDEVNLEDYTNTGVTIQSVADSGTSFLSSPTKYVGATRPCNVALLACIKY